MDAGLIHFRQRGHGALQFPFESAAVVDLFGEIAGAKVRAIEQLEADAARFGQARAGKRQPRVRHMLGRNRNRGAGFIQPVFDTGFADLLCNGRSIFGGEPAIKDPEIAVVASTSDQTESQSAENTAGTSDERDLLRCGVRDFQIGG